MSPLMKVIMVVLQWTLGHWTVKRRRPFQAPLISREGSSGGSRHGYTNSHVLRLPMSHAETTRDRADVLPGRCSPCHSCGPSARLLLLLLLFLLLSSAWGHC